MAKANCGVCYIPHLKFMSSYSQTLRTMMLLPLDVDAMLGVDTAAFGTL